MLCVLKGCCVHTQGTHIRGKSVVCGLSVVCTHKVHTKGGKSVVSGVVEWVLCAHTYEGRVLCVCSGCCVHTHMREECCVCVVGVVSTHKGGKSVDTSKGSVQWTYSHPYPCEYTP